MSDTAADQPNGRAPGNAGARSSALGAVLTRQLQRATAASPAGIRRRVLAGARRALLLRGDPTIEALVFDQRLRLPLSHELPIYQASHPDYGRNLGRVAGLVAAHRPRTSIVDIGANVGDSVVSIRPHTDAPILCIEGDEIFLPFLRDNTRGVRGVEIDEAYVAFDATTAELSDSTTDAATAGMSDATTDDHTTDRDERFAVERVGGTARLVRTDAATTATTIAPLAAILARHPALPPPGLLKIDTDGFDQAIIAAAAPTIEAHRPVLFFEWDPRLATEATGHDGREVFALLERLGYRDLVLFANTGEILCRLTPADRSLIDDLAFFTGLGTQVRYYDVCAVPADDAGLADEIVEAEHRHHAGHRVGAHGSR